ncbi:MAG: HIT domain-containing protein [Candidatus Limnocylindria bacterium]
MSAAGESRWSWYQDAAGAKRDWYCEDVLSGTLAIRKVYEDDLVLAFHHRDPEAAVHVVVVPKAHVASLLDREFLDGELLVAMVRAVQHVARALGLDRAGFQLRANAAAPHVTPHVHWHVMGPTLPPAAEPKGR